MATTTQRVSGVPELTPQPDGHIRITDTRDLTLDVTLTVPDQAAAETACAYLEDFFTEFNHDVVALNIAENTRAYSWLRQDYGDLDLALLSFAPRPPLLDSSEDIPEQEQVRIPRALYEQLKGLVRIAAYDPGDGGYRDALGHLDFIANASRTICVLQGWEPETEG